MVLLTMTPTIVEALERLPKLEDGISVAILKKQLQNPGLQEVKVKEAMNDDSVHSEPKQRKEHVGVLLDEEFIEKKPEDSEAPLEHGREELKKNEEAEHRENEKETNGSEKSTDTVSTSSTESSKPSAENQSISKEPSLSNPGPGNPISHSQIIELWTALKTHPDNSAPSPTLESLLRTSKIYTLPPLPAKEPTPEFLALMARLRRDEEARAYHRLTHPAPPLETFAQRFPLSSSAHAFSSHPPLPSDTEDDVSYEEVKRQIGLIINVLVSFFCCGFALWKVARWWSVAPRVALSLGGSLLVVVAEVVIYMGYLRRLGEAKGRERKVGEVKEVVNTWVVGVGTDEDEKGNESITIEKEVESGALRRRKNGT